MKKRHTPNPIVILIFTISLVWAPPLFAIDELDPPTAFTAGTTAKSTEVNQNFTNVYDKVNEMIQQMETMAQNVQDLQTMAQTNQDLEQRISVLEIKNSFMIRLPAGTFAMGDNYRSNSQPIHTVILTQDFFIMDHEVTAAEYKDCVDARVCAYSGSTTDPLRTYGVAGKENHPVNFVSWNDAQDYIEWKNHVEPGQGYRLCTEAEWEYAARAGSSTKYSCGNDPACLDAIAWYADNNTPEGTKAVRTKQPNAWGVYDMHGNVQEWVNDWFGDYGSGPDTDPTGPVSAEQKVVRYGAFESAVLNMDVTARGDGFPNERHAALGFRLCGDD